MASKYGLAKDAIAQLNDAAASSGIDAADAQEALLISLVQTLKELRGADNLRGVLQYEVDSLGSGGVHEIQRR